MADSQKFTQKLRGQRVLVIGGSSGIGFGVAEGLVEHGAIVSISSSSAERVSGAVDRLQQTYPSAKGRISGHVCNLGDEATVEANIVKLFEAVGGLLDHIVYTAADSLAVMKVEDVSLALMHSAGLLRLFAPMLVAKRAPRYMSPGPRSSITFTSGTIAEKPIPDWTVIGAYGAAITGMTRGLALDLKPIRVNCVAPGLVDTEMWTTEQRKGIFPEVESKVPTGRVAQPQDVAEAYLFLIRDWNATGSVVSSNGGALLV